MSNKYLVTRNLPQAKKSSKSDQAKVFKNGITNKHIDTLLALTSRVGSKVVDFKNPKVKATMVGTMIEKSPQNFLLHVGVSYGDPYQEEVQYFPLVVFMDRFHVVTGTAN